MLQKARYNEPRPASAVHKPDADDNRPVEEGSEEIENSTDSPDQDGLGLSSNAVAGIPPDLRRVLSLADAAILLLDDAGFFVFANEAARSLLDYGKDEILGVHFSEICVHDLAWLEAQFQRFKRNEIWGGHIVLRGKRGHLVNVAVNAAVFTRTSEPVPIYVALIHPVNSPVQASAAELEDLPYGLTAAEVRILQLLIEGFGGADIAVIQGENESAITLSIEAILRKTHVSSVIEACIVALKKHLVT